jgi:hypothetical protein
MKHVDPVAKAEEQRWRNQYPYAIRSGAYGGSSLHLPDSSGKEPKCDHVSREEWRQVEWECWPMGHEEICKLCAKKERLE